MIVAKIAEMLPEFAENVVIENKGKLIVRMSGTEPLVRISAEGEQIDLLQKIVNTVSDIIKMEESC